MPRLAKLFSDHRVNVKEMDHERAFLLENVGFTQPTFTLETRDHAHIQEVSSTIQGSGWVALLHGLFSLTSVLCMECGQVLGAIHAAGFPKAALVSPA
jgi:hypothetical protein